MNRMKEVKIEKITLNMGTGESGDKLKKAVKLLTKVTGSKPVIIKSQKRIPTWNVRPGLEIGTKVTLRKEKAIELLKKLFAAVDNRISPKSFDNYGNFSFGIPEYLDIKGVEYDPEIGIVGFEVSVTLERNGYRVKKRKLKSSINKNHIIGKEDAMKFIKDQFKIRIGIEE